MSGVINVLYALFLILHGFAHLVGFVVPWRLATLNEMPYKTTLLNGRIDVLDVGIKINGIFWLLLAIGFIYYGSNLLFQWSVLTFFPTTLVCVSFLMCVLGWPDAKIGVWVNLAILGVILLDHYFQFIS